MVGITFGRPVGPYADAKELEFVSALHQTGAKSLRQDGTINAKDVMHFLCSRHGLRVEEDVVQKAILEEFVGSPAVASKAEQGIAVAGGEQDLKLNETTDTYIDNSEEEDDEGELGPSMDLCQMLTLLLIPFLRGGNPDGYEQEAVGRVVEIALDTIWAELRSHSIHVSKDDKEEGVLVTVDNLREIMELFGECNLPDSILQEMITAASGNTNQKAPHHFYMTKASFLQALTADTQLLSTNVEESKSTHFDDARKAREMKRLGDDKKEGDASSESAHPFLQLYTASNIDNNADTYRSTAWFVFVWTSTVWVYLCYISGGVGHKVKEIQGCDHKFGCDIALALINWSTIALLLMFYGFVWIMVSNLGNSTSPTESISSKVNTAIRVIIGMLLVFVVTIASFIEEVESDVYNTSKFEEYEGAYIIVLVMGICIMLFQLNRLLGLFVPLGPLSTGGQEYKEQRIKKSASSKILKFVEHATLLHVSPPDDQSTIRSSVLGSSVTKSTVSKNVTEISKQLHASSSSSSKGSSTAKVLMNYHHMQDFEEETGGVVWTYKKLFDGSLLNAEGIYLHGRLMAVNTVQFLITFFLIGYVVTFLNLVEDTLAPIDDGCTFRVDGILVQSDPYAELYPFYQLNLTGFAESVNTLLESTNATFEENLDALANFTTENAEFLNETLETLTENYEEFQEGGFANLFNLNETHYTDGFRTYMGQFPLFNGTMFDNGALTVCYDYYITNGTDVWQNEAAMQNEFVSMLNLEKWEYTISFSFGLIAAILAALTISFAYIPSYVSSVLKYRSGFNPSLKGNYVTFLCYRKSPDSTAVIWGSAFWGILATAGIVFLLFAGVTFMIAYSETRKFVTTLLAQYVGIFTTIAVKTVIMMVLRKSFYAGGYYRKRPAASNIMNVLLEAWNLGLSIGTVTSRIIKLIVVACFYVGRIDTPCLAPGVGCVGGSSLDAAPDAFRKDLLIHEAHRHPFIERLGFLYLLKLYNGKDFGTRAGSYWRMLFVLAVFPWMRNYRIRNNQHLLQDVNNDLVESGKDHEDDEKSVKSVRIAENVWNKNDSIEILAAKRRALKNQLMDLNNLLSRKLGDAEAVDTMNSWKRKKIWDSTRCDASYTSNVSI